MNKATVETVSGEEFKNIHRKHTVSIFFCRWKVQVIQSRFYSWPINLNIQGYISSSQPRVILPSGDAGQCLNIFWVVSTEGC